MQVRANTSWSSNDFAAWVDYDNDRTFEQSEQILYTLNSGQISTVNLTVPATVSAGDTVRMRIRLSYFGAPYQCGDQFGEVEDHLVFLRSVATKMGENGSPFKDLQIIPNLNSG